MNDYMIRLMIPNLKKKDIDSVLRALEELC